MFTFAKIQRSTFLEAGIAAMLIACTIIVLGVKMGGF
jgi:hypothetical protein